MENDPGRSLDAYLVALSQAGSVEALDGVARRWTPRLLRYAARVLGGSADGADAARDVVQNTWVAVIRGLRGLRDPAQFQAWIYGIATRKCIDYIRARARRRRIEAPEGAGDMGALGAPGARPQPEVRIDLAAAIRRLPPTHRAALHLYYSEELSVDEVASALAIPAGTVKSRLHHAREALKRQLQPAAAAGHEERDTRKRGIS